MDLTNFANEAYCPDEGAVLELRDPKGAPLKCDDGTRMTLTLLGKDAEAVVRVRDATTDRYLKERERVVLTSAGTRADGTDLLARATVGWNIQMGGEKPACTYDAAVALYENPKLAFIREQADAFIAERGNFVKASR